MEVSLGSHFCLWSLLPNLKTIKSSNQSDFIDIRKLNASNSFQKASNIPTMKG